jgi:hypothetical protein
MKLAIIKTKLAIIVYDEGKGSLSLRKKKLTNRVKEVFL